MIRKHPTIAFYGSKHLAATAVEPLIDSLNDDDSDIREAIVRLLGEIGDKRAIMPLLAMLNVPSDWVRDSVRSALTKLGYTAQA
jgi:HEAT repeat protein